MIFCYLFSVLLLSKVSTEFVRYYFAVLLVFDDCCHLKYSLSEKTTVF